MRPIVWILLVACAGPPCPAPGSGEDQAWWPLPGQVRVSGNELDAPSRAYLDEIVGIMQTRSDVRAVRVEAHTEEQARLVADILAGMGVPRAMIEIVGGAHTNERVELSLLLAREG